ncbi:MAG: hypothetical protein ACP5GU_05255 [Thermoprotei archaeon]|jgi:hypothetical protein
MSYSAPSQPQVIQKDKVRNDVMNRLLELGIKAEFVSRCNANIEYMDSYVTYFYANDWNVVKATLEDFVETKFKPSGAQTMYVWFTLEGNYRYLHVGFFTKNNEQLIILRKITIGVSLY